MGTQDSFMFVVKVVERLVMVSESGLEVGGAPHVLLHLHLPVHLGLLHLRQIHNVGCKALTLERASVGRQLTLGAVAVYIYIYIYIYIIIIIIIIIIILIIIIIIIITIIIIIIIKIIIIIIIIFKSI